MTNNISSDPVLWLSPELSSRSSFFSAVASWIVWPDFQSCELLLLECLSWRLKVFLTVKPCWCWKTSWFVENIVFFFFVFFIKVTWVKNMYFFSTFFFPIHTYNCRLYISKMQIFPLACTVGQVSVVRLEGMKNSHCIWLIICPIIKRVHNFSFISVFLLCTQL